MKVKQGECSHPLHRAFIQAGDQVRLSHEIFLTFVVQAGIGYTADMNGFRQEGIGPMDMTIHNGTRFSASRAYLWPVGFIRTPPFVN